MQNCPNCESVDVGEVMRAKLESEQLELKRCWACECEFLVFKFFKWDIEKQMDVLV